MLHPDGMMSGRAAKMALLGQTFPIKCIASGADGGEGRRMQRVFALIFPEPRNSSRGNDCWDSSFRILKLEYIACVSWELTVYTPISQVKARQTMLTVTILWIENAQSL